MVRRALPLLCVMLLVACGPKPTPQRTARVPAQPPISTQSPPPTGTLARTAIQSQTVPLASSMTPSHTPVPPASPGPTSTPCTLDARFVRDVTIPDNTVLQPGVGFTKTWEVVNAGTCDWGPAQTLQHVGRDTLVVLAPPIVPTALAGAKVQLSVQMQAPQEPGTYRTDWRMCTEGADCFGSVVFAQIIVPTATPSATLAPATPRPVLIPTAALAPGPPPARVCCKYCCNSQPCGNSCISWSYTCHKPPGCACSGCR